jgi:hypothetical protein
LCHENVAFLDPAVVKEDAHPVLAQLAHSFKAFKVSFMLTNNNFWSSHLFMNTLILKTDGNLNISERWLNSNVPRLSIREITGIKVSDILNVWQVKRLDKIIDNTNCLLSLLSYMRLAEFLNKTKSKFKDKNDNDGSSHSLEFFLSRFKNS